MHCDLQRLRGVLAGMDAAGSLCGLVKCLPVFAETVCMYGCTAVCALQSNGMSSTMQGRRVSSGSSTAGAICGRITLRPASEGAHV